MKILQEIVFEQSSFAMEIIFVNFVFWNIYFHHLLTNNIGVFQ